MTREDAEGVTEAEVRNNPDMVTHPGGVAASMGELLLVLIKTLFSDIH